MDFREQRVKNFITDYNNTYILKLLFSHFKKPKDDMITFLALDGDFLWNSKDQKEYKNIIKPRMISRSAGQWEQEINVIYWKTFCSSLWKNGKWSDIEVSNNFIIAYIPVITNDNFEWITEAINDLWFLNKPGDYNISAHIYYGDYTCTEVSFNYFKKKLKHAVILLDSVKYEEPKILKSDRVKFVTSRTYPSEKNIDKVNSKDG